MRGFPFFLKEIPPFFAICGLLDWGILKRRQKNGGDFLRRKSLQTLLLSVFFAAILFTAASAKTLIPGGNTIGMKAYAAGLVVTKVEPGSSAERAGLQAGDVILSANGKHLESAEALQSILASGQPLQIAYSRGGNEKSALLTPERSEDGYKAGAFVRDNVAGIGTVTYYDPENGAFGALGHGISEPGGASLLPITGGEVIPSSVSGVLKSVAGSAGQLQGEFEPQRVIGRIGKNTPFGVFGEIETPHGKPMESAEPNEVHPGKAAIYANLDGTDVSEYQIEIVRCYDGNSGGRDLLLRMTDPKLLERTGGIVQGMSGSPIVQDGKLVGAVTHVLVNQPDMGYGIYVDTMLRAAEQRKAA